MRWSHYIALEMCVLAQVAPAQVASLAGSPSPESESPAVALPRVEDLCESMVKEGQEIESLLTSVVDKESADLVAPKLGKLLDVMNEQLQTLARLPVAGSDNTQVIKTLMTSLTHISQSCLTSIQRLSAVNAYGSSALMEVLGRYNVGDRADGFLQPEDLPQTRLYNELADSIEDALFVLRKVRSEADARDAVSTVRELLGKIERTHDMLTQLAPPLTYEQKEVLQPVRNRMRAMSEEIKKVSDALQVAGYYQQAELPELLVRLARAAAS